MPRLRGRHQIYNAGTAIAVADIVFGNRVSVDALARGLTEVKWPARLELLPVGELHKYVSEGTEIWLDGGHNAAAGQAIAQALADFDDRYSRKVHLIWGMMEFKDAKTAIAPFKGLIDSIYTVPIPGETNAFSAEALAEIAASEGFQVTAASSVRHALLLSQAAFRRPGRVLFFGSLYLAGHVLALHFNRQRSMAGAA